jgi:hypothetical protein
MKFRFWATVSAAALSTAVLATGPVMAQSSLHDNVANQLAEHDITIENLKSMSNPELAQIQLILNTTEGGDAQKRAMVESLLAEQGECEGNPQLRLQVAHQLEEHRIQVSGFDNITGTQLVVVKTVLDSPYSDSEKKAQIERVFAAKAPMSRSDYLRADTEQCVKAVGADVDIDSLTPEQMLQIQNISGGTEPVDAKRQMIENIAQ